MMLRFPVACLANLTLASTASAPLFEKKNESIEMERTFTYSKRNMDKPPKLTFKIKIGRLNTYILGSWNKLQKEYDRLMK